MTTAEKIKIKLRNIELDEIMERLKIELNIEGNENINQETAKKLLEFAIYSSILIILDITHQKYIDECLYSILIDMTKDYWALNKYDKKCSNTEEDEDGDDNNSVVTSIKEGDTQVNFSEKTNTTSINGITYSTGTINFNENILREKYKKSLYSHRKLRWGI